MADLSQEKADGATLDALRGIAEALVVRPGDTLVVRLGTGLSADEFEQFRVGVGGALKERMSDVDLLFIGNVEQIAVYRPEANEAAAIAHAIEEATASPGKVVEVQNERTEGRT